MPVTLLYVGNVAFALMSLQNLNIPMYNTLKRMTPVIVLVTKASLAIPFTARRQRRAAPCTESHPHMPLPQMPDSCRLLKRV